LWFWFASHDRVDQSGIREDVWVEKDETPRPVIITMFGELHNLCFGEGSFVPSKATDESVDLSHNIFLG
jgi:hypothetical protein